LRPQGYGDFYGGESRIGWQVNDVFESGVPGQPPVTTKCDEAVTVAMAATHPPTNGGSYDVVVRHSDVVFKISLDLPLLTKAQALKCPISYSWPGSVPGGQIGNHGPGLNDWLQASSAAVPISAFDTAKQVVVAISSDRTRGPQPNCGVNATNAPGVKCSQSGSWQGQLTLPRARNG
jgi:hypothetical protein